MTGPFKVNGVPLKRVNQAYVQATSTRVDLAGVDVAKVEDDRFVRPKVARAKKTEANFFAAAPELSPAEKEAAQKRRAENTALQTAVDKALLNNIKKTPLLKKYLSSRFTIGNTTRVHDRVF